MPNKAQLFWDFSIGLYEQEGVADACLELQDEFHVDINLILFCYWYGSRFGEVDQRLLREIIDFSTEWRDKVVQPLRNVRTWMKTNPGLTEQLESLRQKIKDSELAAEKLQQEEMERLTVKVAGSEQEMHVTKNIRSNLESLLQELSIDFNEGIESKLQRISAGLSK